MVDFFNPANNIVVMRRTYVTLSAIIPVHCTLVDSVVSMQNIISYMSGQPTSGPFGIAINA